MADQLNGAAASVSPGAKLRGFCPFTIQQKESSLVDPQTGKRGTEVTGLQCLGNSCAMWMNSTDGEGHITGGNCAYVAQVQLIGTCTALLAGQGDMIASIGKKVGAIVNVRNPDGSVGIEEAPDLAPKLQPKPS